jgi:DNA-binding LytR/AlgR family response regulator
MRIAICDDEQKELDYLQSLVNSFDASIDISLHPSAESLMEEMNITPYDIILLDIELDGMNGYDAALEIVKRQNPPLIVLVTNSGEYTLRGYKVAFSYVRKPVSFDELAAVLSAAIERIMPQKLTIAVHGHSHVLSINDIIYFEMHGHRLMVYTKTISLECRMRLSELEAILPNHVFAKPHKGYLVNLDYVNLVGENAISLTDNVPIPLSRRYRQSFEQALFRFVRRQQ